MWYGDDCVNQNSKTLYLDFTKITNIFKLWKIEVYLNYLYLVLINLKNTVIQKLCIFKINSIFKI